MKVCSPFSAVQLKKRLVLSLAVTILLASCGQKSEKDGTTSPSPLLQSPESLESVSALKTASGAAGATGSSNITVTCSDSSELANVQKMMNSLGAHFAFLGGQPPFFWWANLVGTLLSPVKTAKATVETSVVGALLSLSGANLKDNGLVLSIWFDGLSSVIPYPARTEGEIYLTARTAFGSSKEVGLTAGSIPPFGIDPVELTLPVSEKSFARLPNFSVVKVSASYCSCSAELLTATVDFVE